MDPDKKAFTVMEMVIVILVVTILAVVIVPRIAALYPIRLSGAAEKLASDLRYTQNLPMSKHIKHRIVFDVNAQQYAVECYKIDIGWEAVEDPLGRGSNLSVDYTSDSRYQGIKIDSAEFPPPLGSDSVEFDSTLGKPSSKGEVVLSCSDASYKVKVTANTGRVSIE